jgi:glycosyltransferase involved in cell wall biosynthesis
VRRTRASAEAAGVRYEIIFVDDGSTDATPLRIDEQHEADAAVKTVRFTRSFGHQAALSAGLEYASGDAVITMDGDLQHPPEVMSDLVKSWRAGADVVYTERRLPARYQNTLKARFSRLFYQAQTRLTNLPPEASNADFRLMDRRAVENYNRLTEHFVFVRGLVPWLGFAADRIEYEVEDRFAGDPKFTPRQMVRLALDGIFSFTVIPLRLITLLGLFTTFLGVCYATFALASFALGYTDKTGWTSLVVLVLLFGGVQLMSLGIVSEYIGRIYEEVKGRPRYVIDSLSGFERR